MNDDDKRPTVGEVMDSLTGFDELAIRAQFGDPVERLGGTMIMRALHMVTLRRADPGLKAPDAYSQVMALPLGDVTGLYREDDETDPEDPVTPSGEGDSTPALPL